MKQRLGLITLGAALALAPLAIGGVHLLVIAAIGVLATIASASAIGSREGSVRVSPLFLALACAVGIALVQLLPMPGWLLGVFSPAGHAHAETTRALIGAQAWPWRTISMDPWGTLDRVVRWGTLALMVFAASNVRPGRRARHVLHGAIVGGAGLSLVGGLVQRLIDPKLILGFYEAQVPADLGSTFVNWNHAASLYVLCIILCCFTAMDAKRRKRVRVGAALGVVIFFTATWLNQSTSASALSVVVLGVCVATALASWRGWALVRSAWHRVAVWGGAATTLAVFVGIWVLAPSFVEGDGVHDSVRGRVALAKGAWGASAEYWRAGAGAGATEKVIYPHVDWSLTQEATIVTVESEIFGWWLELGALGASIVFVLLIVAALGPALRGVRARRWRASHTEACVIAIFSLIILQLHFPLWAIGLGGPLFVAWELARRRAAYAQRDEELDGFDAFVQRLNVGMLPKRRASAILAVVALATGASALGLWSHGPPSAAQVLEMDRAALDALAPRWPSESQVFLRRAQLLAAEERGLDDVRAHIERASALEPTPRVRAVLATTLAMQGAHDEALTHYHGVLFGPARSSGGDVITLALSGTASAEERARIFAPGTLKLWRKVGETIREREGDLAEVSFALALLDERPEALDAFRYVIEVYDQIKRPELVELWAMHLLEADVDDRVAGREEAIWRLARSKMAGDPEGARELIERGLESMPARAHARLEREILSTYDAASILALEPAELTALEARRERVCRGKIGGAMRHRCLVVQGHIHEARGDLDQAERAFVRAADTPFGPMTLATFHMRQGRCLKLKSLAMKESDSRQRERIEALVTRCYTP